MRINMKKTMSLAVATLITVTSTGIYAASFTDISKHWAKPYIEKGKSSGLIEGVSATSYEPETYLTKIQAIILASRLLNPSQDEVDKAMKQYEAKLATYKLESWTIQGISVALSKGIIDESILPKLLDSSKVQTPSSREEIAEFMIRAIGLEKEAKSKGSNIVLNFKDANTITESSKAYILVMNEKKIMSGDDNGNFNPKAPIKRGEMAKVLSESYDYLQSNKKKDDVIATVSGTIQSVFSSGGKEYIKVNDALNTGRNYELSSASVLKIRDKVVTPTDLSREIGLNVILEVITDEQGGIGLVKTLNSQWSIEKYSGTIYYVNEYGKVLTLEHQKNGVLNRDNFSLTTDTEIILDGKKVSFSDLRKGDSVKVEAANDKLTKIEAEAKVRDLKGILKEINEKEQYIVVEDKDKIQTKYELHKTVKIDRNRRTVSLDKLKKGDEVEIHIEDKKVTTIDAKIVEKEIEGTIREKTIGYSGNKITILNKDTNKEETYVIPAVATIEVNGNRAKIDDLEHGYHVLIKLEGEEIVSIESKATTIKNKRMGVISYMGESFLEMTLEGGGTIEVIIGNAVIREYTGSEISKRYLREGDEILVIGDIYPDEIIADQITRFTK